MVLNWITYLFIGGKKYGKKIEVRYYSRGGNTEKFARAIGEELQIDAKDVSVPLEEDVDILFLGSSVYAAGVDDHIKEFISNISVKVGMIVNFSTAAIINSTYSQVKKLLEVKEIPMSNLEYHTKGSFGLLHKGRPNDKDLNDVKEFARNVVNL